MHVIPGGPTLHAFGMAGLWAGLVMQKLADKRRPGKFFTVMGVCGVIMWVAAIVSHQYWIISKLQATPTWLFYCCAIFFPFYAFIYWLTDVRGKSGWFVLIKPAGTVTLTCYIIPYAWYSIQFLLGLHYPAFLQSGVPGLIRSLVFSFLVIGVAWVLMKLHIRLKV